MEQCHRHACVSMTRQKDTSPCTSESLSEPTALSKHTKTPSAVRKIRRRPLRSESLPQSGVPIAAATMYEVPTQAKVSKDWNSPTMVGSAVEMIDTSIVASITDSINEPKTNQSCRVENPGRRMRSRLRTVGRPRGGPRVRTQALRRVRTRRWRNGCRRRRCARRWSCAWPVARGPQGSTRGGSRIRQHRLRGSGSRRPRWRNCEG